MNGSKVHSGSAHPKAAIRPLRNDLSAYNGTPAQPQPRESGITQWGKLRAILRGVKFPEQTLGLVLLLPFAWGPANNTGKSKSQNTKGGLLV